MSNYRAQLLEKIASREARVAIIGLGYVGLPLAVTFAEAGFRVTGIDVDPSKVEAINRGESYVTDVPSDSLHSLLQRGLLTVTSDFSALAAADAVSICVPTPLRKTGDPDISYIVSASEEIARYLHPGMVLVLESTSYPGTTSEVLLPRFENDALGLTVGQSFFLAFSPERVDPGRTDWTTQTTPKVIGGVTTSCLEVASAYYGAAVDTVVPVSSTEAAEMVKLLENTFRAVNIGLANEVLLMCDTLGLDAWEVIDAAATKPFGYMKFTPGPGLGGHCIPIDPLYLAWRLRALHYNARFIDLASAINSGMPLYWVQKVQDALNEVGKPMKGSVILVLGVAYKKDVSDVRESPALDIINLLQARGANVQYHDPYVPSLDHEGLELASVTDLGSALSGSDCVIVVTDHDRYDRQSIRRRAPLLVDTRRTQREMTQGSEASIRAV